jgi:hypothetical protein
MLGASLRKRLKIAGNVVFIGIAWVLFILNIVSYASVYLRRDNYSLEASSGGMGYYIIKARADVNGSNVPVHCESAIYSQSDARLIDKWFLQFSTDENRLFHAFFWYMMITSLVVSILPPLTYVINYCKSDRYKTKDRYCLSSINHFTRTFFSMTIFIFPSFYMKTFDFDSSPCLKIYPRILSIDILPFVFATFVGLSIYFLVYFTLHQFYAKYRFCCTNECLSYGGLFCLSLLMIGIILFSAAIVFYVWIVSFIETPLRVAAILIIAQVPFLPVQLLVD